ncbi:MAG: hypothetical protein GC131_03750 [Alphaproteobacteria bacterium]|nr:hypothetical protein [Alphaproteobacteria bacterium]
MAKMQKITVHGKSMEIYPASDELIRAYKAGNKAKVKKIMDDTRPETHEGYVAVGGRGIKGDYVSDSGKAIKGHSYDTLSLTPIDSSSFDRSKFERIIEPHKSAIENGTLDKATEKKLDDAADAEVIRQIGEKTVATMLTVHQFVQAGQEIVAFDYVPDRARALVFYGGNVFLIAKGIDKVAGKTVDVGRIYDPANTPINPFPVRPATMAHALIHAFDIPHAS